jgi:hypothetical protein
MTTTVITAQPDASLREIANLLLEPGRSGKAARQQ